jgi:Uncharacterized conserved protein (DUF2299)
VSFNIESRYQRLHRFQRFGDTLDTSSATGTSRNSPTCSQKSISQICQLNLEALVTIADEHRKKFESLPEDKRREILWKLRFRLLLMSVDFAGVAEPMQAVMLTQRMYLDGLSKDSFIQRFLIVRNAVIAVIWSIIQDLEGVEPPAESIAPKTHKEWGQILISDLICSYFLRSS